MELAVARLGVVELAQHLQSTLLVQLEPNVQAAKPVQ